MSLNKFFLEIFQFYSDRLKNFPNFVIIWATKIENTKKWGRILPENDWYILKGGAIALLAPVYWRPCFETIYFPADRKTDLEHVIWIWFNK